MPNQNQSSPNSVHKNRKFYTGIIVVFFGICSVFLVFSGPVKNASDSSNSTGYQILKSSTADVPNGLSVTNMDVRLVNGRVSEDRLKVIAKKIWLRIEPASDQRIFIWYYLPSMLIGQGVWASAKFEPDLILKINGLSKREAEEKVKASANTNKDIIGIWSDGRIGSIATFYSREGKTFVETKYKKGREQIKELDSTIVSQGRRFSEIGNERGEYWIMNDSVLEHHNEDGLFQRYTNEKND